MQRLGAVFNNWEVNKYLAESWNDFITSTTADLGLGSPYEPAKILVADTGSLGEFYVYRIREWAGSGELYFHLAKTQDTLIAYSVDYVFGSWGQRQRISSDIAIQLLPDIEISLGTGLPLPFRQVEGNFYIPANETYLLIGYYAHEDQTYLVDKNGNAVSLLTVVRLNNNMAIGKVR